MRTGLRTASSAPTRLFQEHLHSRCTKTNWVLLKSYPASHRQSQVRSVSVLSHTAAAINKDWHRYKPTAILNPTFQPKHDDLKPRETSRSFSTKLSQEIQPHNMDITPGDATKDQAVSGSLALTLPNKPATAVAKLTDTFDPTWDHSDDEDSLIETWGEIVQKVTTTTETAILTTPIFDLSTHNGQAAFQSHWRGVFSTLEESIASDDSIPQYLTSPPVKNFDINLFTEDHHLHCPCCLPGVPPNIALENETGVTKQDFIKGLAGYLYGSDDKFPVIYSEDELEKYEDHLVKEDDKGCRVPGAGGESTVALGKGANEIAQPEDEEEDWDDNWDVSRYRFPALVYMANWMSSGTANGQPVVYNYHGDCPQIWLYCCKGDEIGDKFRKEDEGVEEVKGERTAEKVEIAKL